MTRLRAAIIGGSGYVGGELLRLLVQHPHIELQQVTSERRAGRVVTSTHPNLRGVTNLRFTSAETIEPCDLLFLCLPHGRSSRRMDEFAALADRIVDCSADFRLRDRGLRRQFYGEDALPDQWQERFVYGLPELTRQQLRGAHHISGVGCNATATILALWPLAREGWIEKVVVEVKVGSSEAGAGASEASHHPERSGAVRSFAPTGHRHQAEICEQLQLDPACLFFSATAIGMVRGVLATCHVFLRENVNLQERDLWRLYRSVYGPEPFVRLVKDRSSLYRYPEPKILAGTNYCDVGWELDEGGRRVVLFSAIDNLVKGAAGSAVQSLNVAEGWEERSGLQFPGLHPV